MTGNAVAIIAFGSHVAIHGDTYITCCTASTTNATHTDFQLATVTLRKTVIHAGVTTATANTLRHNTNAFGIDRTGLVNGNIARITTIARLATDINIDTARFFVFARVVFSNIECTVTTAAANRLRQNAVTFGLLSGQVRVIGNINFRPITRCSASTAEGKDDRDIVRTFFTAAV